MGLAELVVIGAVVIALALFIFFANARTANNQLKNKREQTEPVGGVDWNAIADAELQSHLPSMKINAIKRYRELTGVGLKEAKEAVEYALAHPESVKKGKSGGVVDTDGAGVRDLIAEGRIEEAIDIYAAFMGIDEFSARTAIEAIQRADRAEQNLSLESRDLVRQLIASGRKMAAIKVLHETENLDLKDAKDMVERMENEDY